MVLLGSGSNFNSMWGDKVKFKSDYTKTIFLKLITAFQQYSLLKNPSWPVPLLRLVNQKKLWDIWALKHRQFSQLNLNITPKKKKKNSTWTMNLIGWYIGFGLYISDEAYKSIYDLHLFSFMLWWFRWIYMDINWVIHFM